jgi:hypothetical protein
MRSKGSPHEMREQARREKREQKMARIQQRKPAADESTFLEKIKSAIVAGADGGQPK